MELGHIAQSVVRLTQEPEFQVRKPHTFHSPYADSAKAFSYWQNYVHSVLVNCLGGLGLSRNSVIRLSDRPDNTTAVYYGPKQQNNNSKPKVMIPISKGLLLRKNFFLLKADPI